MEEAGRSAVLADCHIEPPVGVEIRICRAPLLPVHQQPGALPWHRLECSLPIAEEQEAPARVVARRRDVCREEVLAEEQVFLAIAVEVGDTGVERGSELSLGGQRARLEPRSAI